MAPLEELASPAAVVTSAPLGLLDLVPLAPLVTKDNQAFLEAPGLPACQVRLEVTSRCGFKGPRDPGLGEAGACLALVPPERGV